MAAINGNPGDLLVADRRLTQALQEAAVRTDSEEGKDGKPLPEITEVYITSGPNDSIKNEAQIMQELALGSLRSLNPRFIHDERDNDPRIDTLRNIFVPPADTTKTVAAKDLYDPTGTLAPPMNQLELFGTPLGPTEDELELPGDFEVVKPPHNPELLANFIEVDATHMRCVNAKATDAVGRELNIVSNALRADKILDPTQLTKSEHDAIKQDILRLRQFIEECNPMIGWDGVLARASMDFESVGWMGIEVVRSRDMKIAQLHHVPATRLRVLRGWKGFVEIVGPQEFVFYQNFGEKVVNTQRKDINEISQPYNPRLDGPLKGSKFDWNLMARKNGRRTKNFEKSANELLFMPKHHSNTVYYGMPDHLPALGDIIGNVHIRDYFLQFFDHNTVPQYAIVVEGARLNKDVIEQIQTFFREKVKGKNHSTLIIPVPATGTDVSVTFHRLGAENKEGSFQLTRKNNAQNIMVAHGVSPAIIGIADAANLGSGKGLSQAEIYKDRIVTPTQKKWAYQLNRLFKSGLGITSVGIEFDPLDIRDMQLEMTVWTGYQKAGDATPNEVRQWANLGDALPGGNRAFVVIGTGIQFIDEMEQQQTSETNKLEAQLQQLQMSLQAKKQMQQVDINAKSKQQDKLLSHQKQQSEKNRQSQKEAAKNRPVFPNAPFGQSNLQGGVQPNQQQIGRQGGQNIREKVNPRGKKIK